LKASILEDQASAQSTYWEIILPVVGRAALCAAETWPGKHHPFSRGGDGGAAATALPAQGEGPLLAISQQV